MCNCCLLPLGWSSGLEPGFCTLECPCCTHFEGTPTMLNDTERGNGYFTPSNSANFACCEISHLRENPKNPWKMPFKCLHLSMSNETEVIEPISEPVDPRLVRCKCCGEAFTVPRGKRMHQYCTDVCKSWMKNTRLREKRGRMRADGVWHGGKGIKMYRYERKKKECAEKGIEFKLPINRFNSICNSPCRYCGFTSPDMGIDRLDSSVGYTPENTVPACGECILMRRGVDGNGFIEKLRIRFKHLGFGSV